jgi:UDP-3-O-[3-hydroxymyristoyl] glucosamine N-acyltransferase
VIHFLADLRGKIFTLRCRIFRRKIFIGVGIKLYKRLHISGSGSVYLGKNCVIGGIPGDDSQYVTLDTHSPDAVIRIGDHARLYAARISAKYEIIIGNNVLIEETGILDTDFHSVEKSRSHPDNEDKERCRIVVGDRVRIGARGFITKGVSIGDDVIVMPGAAVITSIKAGAVVCGNPAKAYPAHYGGRNGD